MRWTNINNYIKILIIEGKVLEPCEQTMWTRKDLIESVHWLGSDHETSLCQSLSRGDSWRPHGLKHIRLLCPWNFPSRILKWVAIPFSREMSLRKFHLSWDLKDKQQSVRWRGKRKKGQAWMKEFFLSYSPPLSFLSIFPSFLQIIIIMVLSHFLYGFKMYFKYKLIITKQRTEFYS